MSIFDTEIDRRGTGCAKWDKMEALYGVPAESGISMWVADMDFAAPQMVQDAIGAMLAHGVYGYAGDDTPYREAIAWWMANRHGWQIEQDWIHTTHGLVNAVGLALSAYTAPGDGVVLFTPVYHAFARVIRSAERQVVECQMVNNAGRYELDFATYDAQMTGAEKMLILCSPHNPGGRVWTAEELTQIADFAARHDLILVSDEIHHDLVFPGATHIPMAAACPQILDRLIMLTAPSKTFNLAGLHTGQVIIPDPALRAQFGALLRGLGLSPNSFGPVATRAVYSPAGALWVDELITYLDGNRQLFDDGINAIPGLSSMPLQSTYLAWVDFSGTGMSPAEFTQRVQQGAQIATNHGPSFGTGGEDFLRFNFGTNRARVAEAVERMQKAFGDLQ